MLKSIGPVGAPVSGGGYLPIPQTRPAGCEDMVRISDGRMSGTASSTVVLHVTPIRIGEPLYRAHRRQISLSVANRSLVARG